LRPVDVQRRQKRAARVEGDDSELGDRVVSRARALGRGARTFGFFHISQHTCRLLASSSPRRCSPTLSLSPSADRGSAKTLKGVDACARYSELWRPCPRPRVDGSPMPMPTPMLRLWRRIYIRSIYIYIRKEVGIEDKRQSGAGVLLSEKSEHRSIGTRGQTWHIRVIAT
jgi:hypothetical protein